MMFKRFKNVVVGLVVAVMLFSDVGVANAAQTADAEEKLMVDTKGEMDHLRSLKSKVESGKIKYSFTDKVSSNGA